jgi:hypothetical protein
MPAIEVAQDELLSGRIGDLQSVLAALGRNSPVACEFARGIPGPNKILVAHDGAIDHDEPERSRVRFRASVVECAYLEIWVPASSTFETWRLQEARLTLFLKNRLTHTSDEVLCIHCEPGADSIYKRGPHLHIKRAEHPLPKCHFHLFLAEPSKVLRSVAAFSDALRRVAELVRDEVVPLYPSQS